jgi:hypothetical protein
MAGHGTDVASSGRIDNATDEALRCAQGRLSNLPEEDLMSDALSFAEIAGQQVELLPARTVLSMFTRDTSGGPTASDPTAKLAKLVTEFLLPSTPGTPGTATDFGASGS